MKKLKLGLVVTLTSLGMIVGAQVVAAGVGHAQVWVDDEVYNSIVTPATFDPANGNFDELYAGGGFADGVPLISDSAPGDTDYNGGRWHLNVIKMGVDPAKYASASSVDDLDLSDFESTDTYFECPLNPVRGNR